MLKSKNLSKLLSLLLTLALLTSLFSGIGITASAAEGDAPVQPIEDVYAPDGGQDDSGEPETPEAPVPDAPVAPETPDGAPQPWPSDNTTPGGGEYPSRRRWRARRSPSERRIP
jgi:hypothetical protein